jgi:AraC family transcriptional regulator
MAYRRTIRLRTAGAEWQQVELLAHDPRAPWSPTYRVDTPRLLLPEQGVLELELAGCALSTDPVTGVWLTPDRPYRVRQARAGQRSALLVLAAGCGMAPGPVRLGARWRARLQVLGAAAPVVDALAREEALALLIAESQADHAAAAPRPHPAVRRARAYLAECFAANDTLADIGRAAACSPFQLARQFRLGTGRTLHQHRTELRLAEALHRLDAGERNLSLLAAELGFSSHSHFTAVFRRLVGQAPSTMRTILTARRGR